MHHNHDGKTATFASGREQTLIPLELIDASSSAASEVPSLQRVVRLADAARRPFPKAQVMERLGCYQQHDEELEMATAMGNHRKRY